MTYRDEGGRWSSYSEWYVLLLFWVGLGWWVVASLGNSAFTHSFWYQYTWSYIQYVTFQTLYFGRFVLFRLLDHHTLLLTLICDDLECVSLTLCLDILHLYIWIFIIDCIWWNKGHIVINVCICIGDVWAVYLYLYLYCYFMIYGQYMTSSEVIWGKGTPQNQMNLKLMAALLKQAYNKRIS